MTVNNIPKTIKEIIDAFIRFKFSHLTYETISRFLKEETNTIVQRINRNLEYFQFNEEKPKKITLKKGINEIYFYRDKNQCQICRKTLNPEYLTIKLKDPYMKDKYEWENVITCCKECEHKDLTKRTKTRFKKKANQVYVWEYKEVIIREIQIDRRYYYELNDPNNNNPEIEENNYFEFNELDDNGWFHLLDDDNKISSYALTDVLNYFGDDGWELEKIKYPAEESVDHDYYCLFKKQKLKVANNEH